MKSKKFYIGVDQSLTNTGVVILDDKGKIVSQDSWKPFKLKDIERLSWFYNKIKEIVAKYPNANFALEGYSFGSKFNAAILGELSGIIKLAFFHNGIKPKVYQPTVIKKFATGKGNSKKDLILKAVYKKWAYDVDDDNLADAFCIAKKLIYDEKNGDKRNKPRR